jgi:hypothetical protein
MELCTSLVHTRMGVFDVYSHFSLLIVFFKSVGFSFIFTYFSILLPGNFLGKIAQSIHFQSRFPILLFTSSFLQIKGMTDA